MDVLTPVKQAAYVWNQAADIADHELFVTAPIDEVALLFSSEALLSRFTREAKEGGLEHFDSVRRDVMNRQDTLTREYWDVRFEFLRIPNAPWRIEAMCVIDGFAPLHKQHLETYGNASVVHASYKCEDIGAYMHAKKVLETDLGSESSIPFQAEYRNSYGLFSYWKRPQDDFYFKPRVNLRDK